MEPVATDWLKDYDPLFDLLDEEMRGVSTQAAATNEYLANEYDLTGYYNPCKPTDELSIILGLDCWATCLDLNSPSTNSSSATTSAAPSPASISPTMSVHTSSSSVSSINRHSLPHHHHYLNLQQQPTLIKAEVRKQVINARSDVSLVSNSIGLNTPTSAPKRRKRCCRAKGISLLAPSPKVICSTTTPPPPQPQPTVTTTATKSLSSFVRSPVTVSTPLATLLAVNNNNNNLTTRSPSNHMPANPATSTTTLVAAPASKLALEQNTIHMTYLSPREHQHQMHFTGQLASQMRQRASSKDLTRLDLIVKYCVKIEHAYSLLS